MKAITTFSMKDPIKGVAFSNKEVGLTLEFEVADQDWKALQTQMDEQVQVVVARYSENLEKAIEEGQGKDIQALQIQMDKKYKEKLELAKAEIIKLKEELKNELSD